MTSVFVSLAMQSYKLQVRLNKLMKINQTLLKGIGLTAGIILGYVTILVGVVMTILLLETIFSEI